MKKKPMNTSFFLNNSEGGILLPVMVILLMFILLVLMVTENHLAKRQFLVNTKDFYLARTIEELSLMEMDLENRKQAQYFYYNIGTVEIYFNDRGNYYEMTTSLKNQYKRKTQPIIEEKR